MPQYKYKAARINGKSEKGMRTAANLVELRATLEAEGLFLVESKEAVSEKGTKAFSSKLLSEFCRELGMMLGAGVPLIRALNVMVKRDINVKAKESYIKLHQDLQRGYMLSEAMEHQGNVYPKLLINMYKASEASGAMEQTCMRMAEHYEKSFKLKQKVKGAMIYPIILAIVTFFVVIGVFTFILPKFFSMFEDLNTPLPGITQVMISISKVVQEQWLFVIIGALFIVFGIRGILNLPKLRLTFDKLKLKLPVVGKLLRIIYTARFARTLSSCYTSGISMINALQNTKSTVGNAYIESQFDNMISMVRNGENLSAAIDSVKGFDSKLVANILIGEETGRLDTMLLTTADNFDFEAEVALQKLTAIVEPGMIILMAIIIGTIMVSVLLPLPTMYNSVGNMGGI
ncbi:MAG: type II secretion system F family protein [Anaerovoracaceae bacterium]